MSQVMEGINARGYVIGWLNGVTAMYLKDIDAIPDEILLTSPGGCARPANELTADVIMLLKWTTGALKGTPTESYQDAAKALAATLTTKAAIADAMNQAKDELAAAIGQASDETMNSMVTPPWQMEAPMFIIVLIAVNHIWYHDGQLNYIQCLNGDGDVHWM